MGQHLTLKKKSSSILYLVFVCALQGINVCEFVINSRKLLDNFFHILHHFLWLQLYVNGFKIILSLIRRHTGSHSTFYFSGPGQPFRSQFVLYRTNKIDKVDAVRLYASYRCRFTFTKGAWSSTNSCSLLVWVTVNFSYINPK